MSSPVRINCHQCRHYFVTWERNTPHGCRILGFKSHALPSTVVYQSSGLACLHFESKSLPDTKPRPKKP